MPGKWRISARVGLVSAVQGSANRPVSLVSVRQPPLSPPFTHRHPTTLWPTLLSSPATSLPVRNLPLWTSANL